MNTTTFRDLERLSAYLDGQLPQAEKTRLQSRLAADPALAAALEELRQTRTVLRRTPQRRAPRNFTLTPKMAGIRPPVPRAAPALSWASAVAMLLFVCTLGGNLLGPLSLSAAAPRMAVAPEYGIGGGPPEEAQADVNTEAYITPTPEMFALTAPEPTAAPEARVAELPQQKTARPFDPWLVVWPSLAVLLLGAALLIRGASLRAFRKKLGQD